MVIGYFASSDESNTDDGTPATVEAEASPAPPPPDISAVALFQAYEANEIAAQRDYEDQVFLVTGIVESISDDILGTPYVTLETESALSSVQAMFNDDPDLDALAALSQGQAVTVQCRVDGKFGNVILRECSIP